jgi:pyruvate dehydrogenase E1 component
MAQETKPVSSDLEEVETREWTDSLDYVLGQNEDRAARLLVELGTHARKKGVELPFSANTPYINTIPVKDEPVYPGSREIERRLRSLVRWNVAAIEMGATARDLELSIHPHPTLSETIMESAEMHLGHPTHLFRRKR